MTREEAIKYLKQWNPINPSKKEAVEMAIDSLRQPQIVHCKDCKYRFVDGDNVRFNMCLLNHNKVHPDDWFCADGEKEGVV